MMENHSFDNYFGMLGRGDGFTLDRRRPADRRQPRRRRQPRARVPHAVDVPAPTASRPRRGTRATSPLARRPQRRLRARPSGPVAMGYWTEADLPFYYGLARTFPLCDRWFVLGARADLSRTGGSCSPARPPGGSTTPVPTRCSRPSPAERHDLRPARRARHLLAELLHRPAVGRRCSAARSRNPTEPGADRRSSSPTPPPARCPAFSLVDSDFGARVRGEPAGHPRRRGVRGAASSTPRCRARHGRRTLLIWSYDEHGGYYDHVPPPRAVPPDDIPPDIHVPPDQPGALRPLRLPGAGGDRVAVRAPPTTSRTSCTTTRRS